MLEVTKSRKSKNFQKIITNVIRKKSNTNVKGDMSFAEIQAKRDACLNDLYDILMPVCGDRQACQILDTIRLGQRGETMVDCLPLMAVGEAMVMMRGEVRTAIQKVRSYKTVESVIELDKARACQHCEDMIAVYWMVQKSYYTLYRRFMAAFSKPQITWQQGWTS